MEIIIQQFITTWTRHYQRICQVSLQMKS
jgi:Predicted exporters of the RND superfamily